MVVDDHHIVDVLEPLLGEHADRRRAAADAHPLFDHAVDRRRRAGLDNEGRAAVDRHLDRLAVAKLQQRLAGDPALLLRAAGEMFDPAQRQHLRAVFAGGDVADRLAVHPDLLAFMADMAVGVDLHLHAAIAEDALGDDGDHVHAGGLLRHDEGRGLVVGIGGAGADGGNEGTVGLDDVAAPGFALARQEGHDLAAGGFGVLDDGEGIDPDQFAALVGVTVAGAALAIGDVAHHRAGVAADLALDRVGARLADHGAFP